MIMLEANRKELCYLSDEALSSIAALYQQGITDFDLALETTRKLLGDEAVYVLEE
jgi:hypothetical protein